MMHKNRSVDTHQFAMVPRAEIPRSSFKIEKALKTTFDAGWLVPIFCEEVLPGDTFNVQATQFVRMATPIFPVMDNLHLDTFFFFVPNRLVWTNWVKFMGEQDNPGDSISFVIPKSTSPVGGYPVCSLQDYFGLPTVGQVLGGGSFTHSALPLRAYNLIYDQWFRDENLQTGLRPPTNDGPDVWNTYVLMRRGKRHDYFTSCLPWPQKGATGVSVPLGSTAVIRSDGNPIRVAGTAVGANINVTTTGLNGANWQNSGVTAAGLLTWGTVAQQVQGMYVDLSTATSATINQLRQSFQIQKLLERDARGGTRYTEIVKAHFGVQSPDARLQRPEYLGGGTTPIVVTPIAQTSGTGVTGGSTPLANLAGVATGVARDGFTQSFTEHGHIIGLANVRADLTYQQGVRKLWNRDTRYDYYFPAFAMLGEQAVLNREIYADGSVNDTAVFGYQERWAEYRYSPSQITGLFRSTSAGTLDSWHLSQRFSSLPTLSNSFIVDTPPVARVVAAGAAANNAQFIYDSFWQMRVVRPLPMYSVPGLIDHF